MAAADDIDPDLAGAPALVRAAQYVRMSTDHGLYSAEMVRLRAAIAVLDRLSRSVITNAVE